MLALRAPAVSLALWVLAVSPVLQVSALSPVVRALELSLTPGVLAPWAPELSLASLPVLDWHSSAGGSPALWVLALSLAPWAPAISLALWLVPPWQALWALESLPTVGVRVLWAPKLSLALWTLAQVRVQAPEL